MRCDKSFFFCTYITCDLIIFMYFISKRIFYFISYFISFLKFAISKFRSFQLILIKISRRPVFIFRMLHSAVDNYNGFMYYIIMT